MLTTEQLTEILRLHALYLAGDQAGTRANLYGADLDGANLYGANLAGAYLTGAYLHGANLRDANLRDANLAGANLAGAIMPDGRTYEQWQADPLAGLCAEPEARNRAIAAWGAHTWQDCPLTMGMGIHGPHEAPAEKRLLVATFVALFDGGQLPRPEVTP